jgi:serine/threonine protein kinase
MTAESPPASGSTPQLESPSLVGQVLDGRYRLVRKIGEGGMGEVYAAEHMHIEKRFAIKLLRPEIVSNPEAVTRFRQEARSASSIGHRNIIAIEDFGQLADGRIYMCMELLNGAALNDMITQPMGVDRLLNILIQTGHGLAAAHAKGIIHRDMKPENVFVTIGPNGEDVPKLLDFGIAKVSGNDAQNHLTRTGTIFGTPFYMAPEQALGNPVDARTDVYAVGVIMYECFAGSLPFQGESFMGILTQHITMDAEPVAQRAAKAGRSLPPGLADVITCCLQKHPAQRFATMDDLVNVLVQIYRGIMGPGMSTYMDAFPVMPSSAHQLQPTPPPMPRPIMSGAHASTLAATGPAGSAPILSAGMSGMYPGASVAMPSRSKAGLIVAVLAVLAVGGAVAAFVVVSNKGSDPGSGGGSQIASNDSGSGGGSTRAAVPFDAAPPEVDATTDPEPHDAGADGGRGHTGAGSDHAVDGDGADAGTETPPADVVQVPLFARNATAFDVFENDTKVLDGPGNLEVAKGETRSVVIRARGFKDKKLVVEGIRKKTVMFSLERLGSGTRNGSAATHTGSGAPPPPRPGPDCTNSVVDPSNRACRKQFCKGHPQVGNCILEDSED